MKFCEKCGNQMMDDAVLCTKCGCAADTAAQSTASTAPAVPKDPFASKESIIAVSLGGAGVLFALISTFLGSLLGSLLCGGCLIAAVVGLIMAIKAKKARSTDNLALIAIIASAVGIVLSLLIGVAHVLLLLLALTFLVIYIIIIVATFLLPILALLFV